MPSTVRGSRAKFVGRAGDLRIARSADLARARIGRLADDSGPRAVYLDIVRTHLAAVRSRLDPLTVDRVLAALLTVAAQLEVWLGSGASHDRVAAALIALA